MFNVFVWSHISFVWKTLAVLLEQTSYQRIFFLFLNLGISWFHLHSWKTLSLDTEFWLTVPLFKHFLLVFMISNEKSASIWILVFLISNALFYCGCSQGFFCLVFSSLILMYLDMDLSGFILSGGAEVLESVGLSVFARFGKSFAIISLNISSVLILSYLLLIFQ